MFFRSFFAFRSAASVSCTLKSFGMTSFLWFHKLFLFSTSNISSEVANNMGSIVALGSFWGAAVSPFFLLPQTGVVKRKLSGAELGQIGQKGMFYNCGAAGHASVKKIEEITWWSCDDHIILISIFNHIVLKQLKETRKPSMDLRYCFNGCMDNWNSVPVVTWYH